ncbi:glucosaminidase domain-containing protein [Clostridium gasigenes]|uniref:glucosaminidase domain-containing protein n=1 Tax=Clostridium gasigenes TaxID=94869 RepID=UPI001C0CF1AD|nr:glucosaminidase domain-containing protein [Clostridium gasigenes]MBU3108891.1 glucosaminidase domain-containing protein [Clostridium gasigenes]
MRKYDLKKLIVSLAITFFMMPTLSPLAEEVNKVASDINIKSGEKYEEVRFGDKNVSVYSIDRRYMNPSNSIDTVDDTDAVSNVGDKEEVQKKIEAMKDFKTLKPKTKEAFEVALAYGDGSYTYVESAKTADEAMVTVKVLEKKYNSSTIVPSLINANGQVVYATNSMGRVWNHRGGQAISGSSEITYLYSTSDLNKEITYINQGFVDDVPIIEDLGTSAKIQVNGYNGWINKDSNSLNYDLVVVPINQVTNPSCYVVKDGGLYHYISTNMTSGTMAGYSIRVGAAPSYLKSGVDYYSYDGVYFYTGSTVSEGLNKLITDLKNNTKVNSINNNNPNYNYYEYLPFRTKTNYTADELNTFINNKTGTSSKLRGLGEVLIECQNKYGVNPVLTLAVAINESAFGMSDIAQSKNNIFGINAVDFSPGESAHSFATPADSVREFTKNYISRGYSDPADWRYFGGYLGNKQLGANVKYASDPFWGEKAAQHAFTIDYELSNKDINNLRDTNGYQLAIYTGANEVKELNGSLLYNINPTISGWGGYAGNIVAFKFSGESTLGKYGIFPERTTPLNSGGDENKYNGSYPWNYNAYISSNNVKLINTPNDAFIPGYSKEDVNKDEKIDVEDLATMAIDYNKMSEDNSFKKYLDINSDGIIDIFDFVKVSKEM